MCLVVGVYQYSFVGSMLNWLYHNVVPSLMTAVEVTVIILLGVFYIIFAAAAAAVRFGDSKTIIGNKFCTTNTNGSGDVQMMMHGVFLVIPNALTLYRLCAVGLVLLDTIYIIFLLCVSCTMFIPFTIVAEISTRSSVGACLLSFVETILTTSILPAGDAVLTLLGVCYVGFVICFMQGSNKQNVAKN